MMTTNMMMTLTMMMKMLTIWLTMPQKVTADDEYDDIHHDDEDEDVDKLTYTSPACAKVITSVVSGSTC